MTPEEYRHPTHVCIVYNIQHSPRLNLIYLKITLIVGLSNLKNKSDLSTMHIPILSFNYAIIHIGTNFGIV